MSCTVEQGNILGQGKAINISGRGKKIYNYALFVKQDTGILEVVLWDKEISQDKGTKKKCIDNFPSILLLLVKNVIGIVPIVFNSTK